MGVRAPLSGGIQFGRLRVTAAAWVLLFSASACLDTGSDVRKKSSASSTASPASGSSGSSSSGLVTLQTLLKSRTTPETQVDLIGQNGQIGKYCAPTTDAASSSPCRCTFQYKTLDGKSQELELPPVLVEEDLIRCTYNSADGSALPSNYAADSILVRLRNSQLYSGALRDQFANALPFNPATGSVSANYRDPLLYVSPARHQCRDSLSIGMQLDSSMNDPFLADDPRLTYPLNFYASNLGLAQFHFHANPSALPQNGAGWICPFTPATAQVGSESKQDFRLYSATPETRTPSGDQPQGSVLESVQIFPGNPQSFDRARFTLASRSVGRFSVPISAFFAPNSVAIASEGSVSSPSGNSFPLGYAVKPSRLTAGSAPGKEACPSQAEVDIDTSRYRWAKLWLMRAELRPRVLPVSNRLQTQLAAAATTGVVCNPGSNAYGDCKTDAASAFNGTAGTNDEFLADRVLLNSTGALACMRYHHTDRTQGQSLFGPGATWDSAAQSTRLPYTAAGTVPPQALFGEGTDAVSFVTTDANKLPGGTQCGGKDATVNDPLGLCGNPVHSQINPRATVVSDRRVAGTFSNRPLDPASRIDYVFIVSPVDVHSEDMFAAGGPNSRALPYLPYRFYVPGSCLSTRPDVDAAANPECAATSDKRIRYLPKTKDILTPESAQVSRVFPLCVLQEVAP